MLSLSLAMVLCSGMFSPVFASETKTQQEDFGQILELAANLLGDIRGEQDKYGLAGVEFDCLQLNDHIPTYVLRENGPEEAEVRYYPITENGKWAATLAAAKDDGGTWNGQLSNTFVNELPQLDQSTPLTLVFDNEKGYLVNGGQYDTVATYDTMEDRASLNQAHMTKTTLESQTLQNSTPIELAKASARADTSKFLNVPLITKQINGTSSENNKACWAATARAIGKYYGKDYSIDQIYEYWGREKYEGNTPLIHAATTLQSLYGFSWSTTGASNFSFQAMQNALSAGKPIVGRAYTRTVSNPNVQVGHSVAIRGFVAYSLSSTHAGSFSYVENEFNPATYVAVSITHLQAGYNDYDYFCYGERYGGFMTFDVISR